MSHSQWSHQVTSYWTASLAVVSYNRTHSLVWTWTGTSRVAWPHRKWTNWQTCKIFTLSENTSNGQPPTLGFSTLVGRCPAYYIALRDFSPVFPQVSRKLSLDRAAPSHEKSGAPDLYGTNWQYRFQRAYDIRDSCPQRMWPKIKSCDRNRIGWSDFEARCFIDCSRGTLDYAARSPHSPPCLSLSL